MKQRLPLDKTSGALGVGCQSAFLNPSRQPPEGFATAVVFTTAVMFTTAVVSPSFPLW